MPENWKQLSVEKWRQAQQLFLAALESGDLNCLDQSEDPEVAAAARSLIEMDQRANRENFLGAPLTLVTQVAAESQACVFETGSILAGRFHVLRLLGAGGMGEVYLARDDRLGEDVALKTVRRILSHDLEIRTRFIGEIQSARRVTHFNVCRIFDVFEEGATPFYSMEYLPGETMDQFLTSRTGLAVSKSIALQLAEGLHAAHQNGIIHRDLKPQNVLLVPHGSGLRAVITDFGLAHAFSETGPARRESLAAGTEEYLAPEVRAGQSASVRSDIYAYGKVLRLLLPSSSVATRCLMPNPDDRPASLDPIIRKLRSHSHTRRALLAASVVAIGGTTIYRNWRSPRFPLPGRQRIVLNAFESSAPLSSRAGSLRQLFLAAIRQSPLLAIVPDERMRAVLRSLKLPPVLPAERKHLFAVAGIEKASLIIEGVVENASAGLSLAIRLFRAGDAKPSLELVKKVSSERQLVHLAELAALDLRSDFGESPLAMQASYAPIEQVTSASPEAVELYFDAVHAYELSDASAAINLLDRALSIDPNFALAHLQRALALGASFRTEEGFEAAGRAFQLRNRVTDRERNWIEWAYYNLGGDYVSCLAAIRKNTVLFADEAAFQRQTAGAYCRINRFQDAIPYNIRSVELDPFSGNNWDEYICNLAEGGNPEAALEVYEKLRTEDGTKVVVERGAGLAFLVQGDYPSATSAFQRLGGTAYHDRWARLLCAGPAILQGKFAETAATLEADLAYDYATGEQLRRYTRHDLLGNLRYLMGDRLAALEQARVLCTLPSTAPCLLAIRQGTLLAISNDDPTLAETGLDRLREIERRWPSTHSQGARMHVEGCLLVLRSNSRADDLLSKARGLWPDPLTLYSMALSLSRQRAWLDENAILNELLGLRGAILKHYFPGLLVLTWLELARCLKNLSRFDDASRLYERVLDHWGVHASTFSLIQKIRQEAHNVHRI